METKGKNMKLVIVESPAKCDTIKRYLGADYEVMASFGHVRDLATTGKGGLGVDVDNGFKPSYIISKGKIDVVNKLKEAKAKADEVILATDPDREGEAISWHLAEVLGLPIATTKRLEFHEITRDSITTAMANPRVIDINLVESQETRRILDRIIGFKLSNLLYSKIKSRSAGRVQSATLKIIADREKEIENFVPEEFWNINITIDIHGQEVNLSLYQKDGKSIDIHNKEEADAILALINDEIKVTSISKSIKVTESKPPFTTSTLQQEAFARLKFKTSRTQRVAQSLYEGINVGDEHMGLITYMRTDSTRLSPTYINRASNYIKETFGEEYLGKAKQVKSKEKTQDAHEAIRPTSNHRTPESVKAYLTNEQFALYKLIYNRAVASLMRAKKEEVITVILSVGSLTFKYETSKTIFKGYEMVLSDNEEKVSKKTPSILENDVFKILHKEGEQKFTAPPAHYSEAKIVRIMEEVGIGRPSTYASTIDILQKRKYISDQAGILIITEQGKKTSAVLRKFFSEIVSAEYTASMETKLDSVQFGEESRKNTLMSFYAPFMKAVQVATQEMYKDKDKPTGELCPKCGSPLVFKQGRNGEFVGCSNYPTCKYIKKEPKKTIVLLEEKCPKCGLPLTEKQDKYGKTFLACSGYPNCKFTKSENAETTYTEKDYVKDCPSCGGHLVKKKGKYGTFLACTNYPECKHMEKIYRRKRK